MLVDGNAVGEASLFLKAALIPAVPLKKCKKTAWVKSFSLVGAYLGAGISEA